MARYKSNVSKVKAYVFGHRDDIKATSVYIEKLETEGNWVILDSCDSCK
jgi:hypothetical protein